MDIKIQYGKLAEFWRVTWTLKTIDRLDEHKYPYKLPRGISKNSSEEEIKEQIAKEFTLQKYISVQQELQNTFFPKKELLHSSIEQHLGVSANSFTVSLIYYWTGGSYNFPNYIMLNISNTKPYHKTLFHEIVHLCIHENIIKYSINHWEKERIVDLICNAPEFWYMGYDRRNKVGYGGVESYVDTLFSDLFFSNQEQFFIELQKYKQENNI